MEKHIKLDFERSYFEEIYFKDNNASYWKSSSLGKSPRYIIVFSIILVITVIYISLDAPKGKLSNVQYGMIATVFIGFLLVLSSYTRKIVVIQKWKKGINVFLNELAEHQKHELIIKENSISHVKDDHVQLIKWDQFESVDITKEYIFLKGDYTIFVPAKSMSPSDFRFSSDFITNKIG